MNSQPHHPSGILGEAVKCLAGLPVGYLNEDPLRCRFPDKRPWGSQVLSLLTWGAPMWICVQWVRLWSFQTFHVPKMGRHLPPPWSISENQILHTGPPVWHLACGRACHSFVFLGNLIWLSLVRSSPAPSLEPKGSNAVLSGALSLEGEKVVMGKHHPQRGCRTASRLEAHSPPRRSE